MNPNDVIPPEMLSKNASNDMLLFTAFLSVLIGIILIYLGKKGKQLWMVVWSIGLIFMSFFMAGSIVFGYLN
jgi:hypothetical protein